MSTWALPDMYALSPQTCCLWAFGMHIRQSTHAHVMTITYKYVAIPIHVERFHLFVAFGLLAYISGKALMLML